MQRLAPAFEELGVRPVTVLDLPTRGTLATSRRLGITTPLVSDPMSAIASLYHSVNDNTDSVPGLSRIPGLGEIFKYRNDTSKKTELVIFLRPTVVRDASLNGDYAPFRDNLPGSDFLQQRNPLQPTQFDLQTVIPGDGSSPK